MKRFLVSLIASFLIVSLTACSSGDASESSGVQSEETSKAVSEASSEAETSDISSVIETSEASSEAETSAEASSEESSEESYDFVSEAPVLDPDKLEKFPDNKMDSSIMDDGNFYLKVQTISGNDTWTREFAAKGKDVYANIRSKDKFEWYYSDDKTTFIFDDENKTYEVYAFSPLDVKFFFNSPKTEEGSCTFFDIKSKYVKYAIDDNNSIMHFYRESDGSWLGFQYMFDDKFEEVNLVLEVSDDYPSYASFSIPDDYEFYFEHTSEEISINWDLD